MDKEIHFWFNNHYPKSITFHTYPDTQSAINSDIHCVHTTQIFLCNGDLWDKRRIFIHPYRGEMFEIKLGINEPYTSRVIRQGHNLVRLLLAGEFDNDNINVT